MPKRRKYVKKTKKSSGGGGGSTTPPSSTPSSNSQTIDELNQVEPEVAKSVIPDAPTLSMASQDPLYLERAKGMLDWSEGRGPSRARAHARSHHVGLSDNDLDSRGKPVATSFMSEYDQDKTYATMFGTSQDNNAYNTATSNPRGAVYTGSDIWNKKDDRKGNTNRGGFRTAPLARVAEQRSDGSYDHFNAKVTDAFLKYSKDGSDARVQTLYPKQYERLEAPDNPAVMPQHVSLDDIHDTGKLRHVEPEVKDSSAKGRVLETPAPTEEEVVDIAPEEVVALEPGEVVEVAPDEVVEEVSQPAPQTTAKQAPPKKKAGKKQQQKRQKRKNRKKRR